MWHSSRVDRKQSLVTNTACSAHKVHSHLDLHGEFLLANARAFLWLGDLPSKAYLSKKGSSVSVTRLEC